MLRGEGSSSDLRSSIGRRLAGGHSSGELATDREDSPLQSKRSSMCSKKIRPKAKTKNSNKIFP